MDSDTLPIWFTSQTSQKLPGVACHVKLFLGTDSGKSYFPHCPSRSVCQPHGESNFTCMQSRLLDPILRELLCPCSGCWCQQCATNEYFFQIIEWRCKAHSLMQLRPLPEIARKGVATSRRPDTRQGRTLQPTGLCLQKHGIGGLLVQAFGRGASGSMRKISQGCCSNSFEPQNFQWVPNSAVNDGMYSALHLNNQLTASNVPPGTFADNCHDRARI